MIPTSESDGSVISTTESTGSITTNSDGTACIVPQTVQSVVRMIEEMVREQGLATRDDEIRGTSRDSIERCIDEAGEEAAHSQQ